MGEAAKGKMLKNESQISGLKSQEENGVTHGERRHLRQRGGGSRVWQGMGCELSRLSSASYLVSILEAPLHMYLTKKVTNQKKQTTNKRDMYSRNMDDE